jgi:hypothetical protein
MALTLSQFAVRLEGLSDVPKMTSILRPVFEAGAKRGESLAKELLTRRYEGSGYRSGSLRKSITGSVIGTGGTLAVSLEAGGPGIRHAATQEFGHAMRPRLKRYLAIPFGDAAPGGKLRREFRGVSSLRDVVSPKLFVVRSRDGRLFLAWRTGSGKRSRLRFGFRLTRGPVKIPAKHYLTDAASQTAEWMGVESAAAMVEALTGSV